MSALRAASIARTLSGGVCPLDDFPEAASQSFIAGEFVYRVAGYITVCSTDPAQVLGMVREAGHNTTAGLYNVSVTPFTEDVLIEMCVDAGTDSIEAADHGKLYGIDVASHLWFVDKSDVTATRVRIHKFLDPVGTQHGRVLVSMLPAYREIA